MPNNHAEPQSRNEALLQNILGEQNEIGDPQSRNEAILKAILDGLDEIPAPYVAPPQSRFEELLVELWENGGGGGSAVLIEKTITENGDYSASTDGADGYSSVHVDVAGEEVFFATSGANMYKRKTVIPDTVVDATNDHTLSIQLGGANNLEEFECYSSKPNTAGYFLCKVNYGTSCPLLKKIYMPYIRRIYLAFATLINKVSPEEGFCQFGSVGNSIISLDVNAFFSGSSSWKGNGWTIHVYVDAATLADIPSAVASGQPWGATRATIVYHNSTTGEVITE